MAKTILFITSVTDIAKTILFIRSKQMWQKLTLCTL